MVWPSFCLKSDERLRPHFTEIVTREGNMSIRMHLNSCKKNPGTGTDLSTLSPSVAKNVRSFHATFKEYEPTPLNRLPDEDKDAFLARARAAVVELA